MLATVGLVVGVAAAAGAEGRLERETLGAAMRLAGFQEVKLPVSLVSRVPTGASSGIEGWIATDSTGRVRIFIYTGSETFQCASALPPRRQCLLKLASIIVHEAWHLRHGAGEAEAYAEQLAFLSIHGASALQIAGVHRARAHVLAARVNTR